MEAPACAARAEIIHILLICADIFHSLKCMRHKSTTCKASCTAVMHALVVVDIFVDVDVVVVVVYVGAADGRAHESRIFSMKHFFCLHLIHRRRLNRHYLLLSSISMFNDQFIY